MIEALLFLLIGIVAGCFTGLIPGIHPNTVIFSLLPFYFVVDIGFIPFMALISGLSVAHTFHDFLPALFLKAPEADNALATLPGLEMVAEGLGRKAFTLTVIGGLISAVTFIVVLPLLFLFLSSTYIYLEQAMEYILLFFLLFIVLESESSMKAVLVVIFSGLMGLMVLNHGFSREFILMPVFAGLFAVPAIIYSMAREFEIPEQRESFHVENERVVGGVTGFGAGLLAGTIPGIGAAIATTFLSPLMSSKREEFMTGMGAVNTSDILTSFLALYLIGRPRTGSSVALQTVSQVKIPEIGFLVGCCLLAAGVSGVIALKNLEIFLKFVQSFDFKKLGITTLITLTILVAGVTGLYGLLVFVTSSFIGFLALLGNCRSSCMAVLIVPAIMFFSGGTFI